MGHFLVWTHFDAIGPLVILFNIWVSLREWPPYVNDKDAPFCEGEMRAALTAAAVFWMPLFGIGIIVAAAIGVWHLLKLALRDAPRALQRRHRERVALAEAVAKDKAEAVRYEVERGAHR